MKLMGKCINCEYPGVNGFKTDDGKCRLCGKEFPSTGSKGCEHDTPDGWFLEKNPFGCHPKSLFKTCPFCPAPWNKENPDGLDWLRKNKLEIQFGKAPVSSQPKDSEAVKSVEEIAKGIVSNWQEQFKFKYGLTSLEIKIADALRHERERKA